MNFAEEILEIKNPPQVPCNFFDGRYNFLQKIILNILLQE
jgi:hypothetical protein